MIIAIDGHSSCGKSTVAKDLAEILKYTYIDTGAMYRAVTLFCFREGMIKNELIDEERLKEKISQISIKIGFNTELRIYETFLNNENIEDEIRSLKISNKVSIISKIKFVREHMVRLQREMTKGEHVVMDGRDIGTVVFPNADVKVFMTADTEIRAERRYKEMKEKGTDISFEEVKENIEQRDYIDQNREVSPLKKADDAITLDNSYITPQEQLDFIIKIVKERNK